MTQGAIEVRRELELPQSPAEVWAVIGDFGDLASWHPGFSASEKVEVEGKVHRHLTLADGGSILEEETRRDEAGHSSSYTILESPLPITNYHSTISVVPRDGGSKIVWFSHFDPGEGVDEHEIAGVIGGVYDAGLDALADRFGSR